VRTARAKARLRIRLIHWKAAEPGERIALLERSGFSVDHDERFGPALLKRLKAAPPDAVVVDLTRLPSQGRDVGVALRTAAATRAVPLVFVDGDPGKVARVRQVLPDATYTGWDGIGTAVSDAVAAPATDPVVPASSLAGYSGTPLAKKLGIKEGSRLALLDPPADARDVLGVLPDGVTFADAPAEAELALWFVRSLANLRDGIATLAAGLGDAYLWIAWPKRTSAHASDVTQQAVREAGLSHGLVDFKVCAIDATWSGLKFVRRR